MLLTILLTLALVTAAAALHYEILRLLFFELPRLPFQGPQAGKHRVGIGVMGAMVSHALHILLFGVGFWLLLRLRGSHEGGGLSGAIDGSLWDCTYYAAVCYTSLGLGDIVPDHALRFTTGVCALTGLVLIAWTASFTFLLMQRYWGERGGRPHR